MLAGFSQLFEKRRVSSILKRHGKTVHAINALEATCAEKTREEMCEEVRELRTLVEKGTPLPEVTPRIFALVREAAKRTRNERHFDVQLLGGLVLSERGIAEMRTGEGKTLVATLPSALFALHGRGVHVVTVNDFLARRDAAWMGQVYEYLGLSVGVVTTGGAYIYDSTPEALDAQRDTEGGFRVFDDFLRPTSKHEAYKADITYGTNNEFGFDFLRDNTAFRPEQRVQRGHAYAIVDEVDSILIDEARTPLIISSPAAESEDLYVRFAQIVRSFVSGEDYVIDEKLKAIQITESGITKAEQALNIENLYATGGVKLVHQLETAVRAKALFQKDKEYVVRDGEVVIVDEFTGRMMLGRRWSEGIHQAVEAKEGVKINRETQTLASVTFQNYFRLYDMIAGMTGTASSSSEEFYSVYKLEVVSIPTNRPIARKDEDDLIFQTARGKYQALTRHIKNLHEKGQPVLIGTVSIEDNEIVDTFLTNANIPHEVLNAKNHEREGEIIANAGKKGAVTVATNMAGRGVDIKLGGAVPTEAERAEVIALGGLAVIGTERHEARRIDDQLRGRAGRQGDPGLTQFLVSLEDRLMRVFATDTIKKMMGTFGIPEDEPIGSGMITKALENAQKQFEGRNFDSRKQVLAYDDVLNHQRTLFYKRREQILLGDETAVRAFLHEYVEEDAAFGELLKEKEESFGTEVFLQVVRDTSLAVMDLHWVDQLETMEYIRRSVSLRAYGQRDPLIEYRKEGLRYFKEMEDTINREIKNRLMLVVPAVSPVQPQQKIITLGGSAHASSSGNTSAPKPLYGRNDIVTITNGEETKEMKYKKAEALLNTGWNIVDKSK